jgi:putative aldouronate transport system substrate-binding protein
MGVRELGRRHFLQGSLALAGGAFLSACGGNGGGGKPTSTPGAAAASPPAYQPFTGAKADLAANELVPAGYFSYPPSPPAFLTGEAGSGGSVRILTQANSVAVPVGRNSWWQALNKALGVDLEFEVASSSDWAAKQATVLAGGKLPDVMQLQNMPRMLEALNANFAELTEFLAGDAIKEYPSLAAIPTTTWLTPTYNGRIFGIAQPRPLAQRVCNFRGDLVAEMGASVSVSTGDDFVALCRELTDSKRNRWAVGQEPAWWLLYFLLEMMEAPNRWRVSDGSFTSFFEVPEMSEALDVARKMWADGLMHPDSMTGNTQEMWNSGATVLYFQDFVGWGNAVKLNPDFEVGILPAPKWSGGGLARKHLGPASYPDFFAFRKASPERIQELLRIANYLAAPFGTKEHLLVNYGVEGTDHTMKGTDPVLSDRGRNELIPVAYFSSKYVPLYASGNRELVQAQYDYLSQVLPGGEPWPTVGLYSETALAKGVAEDKKLRDLQNEIIVGRRDLKEWAAAVASWKTNAGDAMRKEYEQAQEKSAD